MLSEDQMAALTWRNAHRREHAHLIDRLDAHTRGVLDQANDDVVLLLADRAELTAEVERLTAESDRVVTLGRNLWRAMRRVRIAIEMVCMYRGPDHNPDDAARKEKFDDALGEALCESEAALKGTEATFSGAPGRDDPDVSFDDYASMRANGYRAEWDDARLVCAFIPDPKNAAHEAGTDTPTEGTGR